MSQTSDLVLDAFKELLWDSVVKAALAKLFEKVAFLAWGPVAALITWVVMKYSDELYAAVKLLIEVELIIFKNKELQKQYGVASLKLRSVALSKGIDSPEFREARDADKKALEPFVRYDRARAA